jgi:ABC-type multidrug transport system ATPase subunit
MQGELALEISDINKGFLNHPVINSLSAKFLWGENVLLLGANGAGKSTLLRMLSTLARPERGSIKLAGTNFPKGSADLIGYLGHESQLYAHLTVRENLELTQKLRGLAVDLSAEAESMDLGGLLDRKVSELSRGMRARAALLNVTLHRPKVLFLDEPTASLDQSSVKFLLERLAGLKSSHNGEMLCLIATHDVKRLEGWANRALVLRGGKIAFDSSATQTASQIITLYLEAAITC